MTLRQKRPRRRKDLPPPPPPPPPRKRRPKARPDRSQAFAASLGSERTREEFSPGSFPIVFPTGTSPPSVVVPFEVSAAQQLRLAELYVEMQRSEVGSRWTAEVRTSVGNLAHLRQSYVGGAGLCLLKHIHATLKQHGQSPPSLGPLGSANVKHVRAITTAAAQYGVLDLASTGERFRLADQDDNLTSTARACYHRTVLGMGIDHVDRLEWIPTRANDTRTARWVARNIIAMVEAHPNLTHIRYTEQMLIDRCFNVGNSNNPPGWGGVTATIGDLARLASWFGQAPPAAAIAGGFQDTAAGWIAKWPDFAQCFAIGGAPNVQAFCWGMGLKMMSTGTLREWSRFDSLLPSSFATSSTSVIEKAPASPAQLSKVAVDDRLTVVRSHVELTAQQLSCAMLIRCSAKLQSNVTLNCVTGKPQSMSGSLATLSRACEGRKTLNRRRNAYKTGFSEIAQKLRWPQALYISLYILAPSALNSKKKKKKKKTRYSIAQIQNGCMFTVKVISGVENSAL